MLVDLDGVGEIRLKDVADITVVDNVGDAYMKLNGSEGVCLMVYKSSTASTSDISNACQAKIADLREDYPGLSLDIVSDQGSYISLYINSILQSLLLGALLAIVVLALFLRDWKPTLIVAFSIPFSVLVALLLMYFSGISLNIMSLGGIALAIGMLVDNSIIVLENHLSFARPRHSSTACGSARCEADHGRGHRFNAYHHLCFLADRFHHGHCEPDDVALRAYDRLCAVRFARGGAHARSEFVALRVQELSTTAQ